MRLQATSPNRQTPSLRPQTYSWSSILLFRRICACAAVISLTVLQMGCDRIKTISSSRRLPERKADAQASAPKSSADAASETSASHVGSWQFDTPIGSPERMSIFKDGHVIFFYPNGNRDDTRLVRGEVRQPEYGPDMIMRLIPLDNQTLVGQIGGLDNTANAVYSSRAKIWRRIGAEPATEPVGKDNQAAPSPGDGSASRDEKPSVAKTPSQVVGHWQAIQGKPGEADQLALFEDGRVLYFRSSSQPPQVIDSHFFGGVFRIENSLKTAVPYGASNLILLSFDQGDQISGIALVWRRISDEPRAERISVVPPK